MKIITGYTGEKHITPADDAGFIKGIVGDGEYVLPTGSKFAATIQSNNEVRIADGELVMQGRHARNGSAYESVVIANGSQGMFRNDLIVARYTKDTSTSVEAISLVAIKGTAASGAAADPDYNTGKIDNGETTDFPLYRVRLNGVAIEAVEQLWNHPYTSTGLSKQLIWQNASPKSTFAAQTISMDLSEYDEVEIQYRQSSESSYMIKDAIENGTTKIAMLFTNLATESTNTYMYSRNAAVNDSGITFAACARKIIANNNVNASANDYLIPVKVWGIKGVL